MVATATANRGGSAPRSRTRLIGRDAERVAARTFLLDEAVPLLSLTGPGGVGKTRLGLAIAEDLTPSFGDGVVWVDLAPLADPALAPAALAASLDLGAAPLQSIEDEIVRYLHPRQTLLLLDNCEHLLVEVGEMVAGILDACPAVQIVATSRAPLRLRGEQELPVAPLPLPASGAQCLASLEQNDAVRLFTERARAVRPNFALTERNAASVAAICQRLDGLPLAIELAAARSKILSPAALLAQMTDRLRLLDGGQRDLPPRQRTMRDAIAWSYDLLEADARSLFRRLAIFAGGFDLDAATAVGGDVPIPMLDTLGVLVDHSLVQRDDRPGAATDAGAPRFRLLETIRQYGLEQLAEHREHDAARDAHAAHFLALAETAEGQLFGGPEQPRWLDVLEADHDNLRVAFDWFEERHDAESCLRLGAALWEFWGVRGHASEGRNRLRRALEGSEGASEVLRLAAMHGLAQTELYLGNTAAADRLLAEILVGDLRLGDKGGMAHAHRMHGLIAWQQDDLDLAAAHLEESLALYRDVAARGGCLWCHRRPWCARSMTAVLLGEVAAVAGHRGEEGRAKPLFDEALFLLREMGDHLGAAMLLRYQGEAERRRGNAAKAEALFAAAVTLLRELDAQRNVASTLMILGDLIRRSDAGNHAAALARASECFSEALALYRELQDQNGAVAALVALAACARERGERERALALAKEALGLARAVGSPVGLAEALLVLGDSALALGDAHQAITCYAESLRHWRNPRRQAADDETWSDGHRSNLMAAGSLRGLAMVAARAGQPEPAARLLGAATALREASAYGHLPRDRVEHQQDVASIRERLSETAFATSWAVGRAWTVAQAVAAGLAAAQALDARSVAVGLTAPADIAAVPALTRREQEILSLLCQRLTDLEIAAHLFLSPRTVQRHVSNILGKLGVANRRDAAAAAVRLGIV